MHVLSLVVVLLACGARGPDRRSDSEDTDIGPGDSDSTDSGSLETGGSGDSSDTGRISCPGGTPTIAAGIHGDLIVGNDVPPFEQWCMTGSAVTVESGGVLVATANPDEDGFYEIPLGPGAYRLCALGYTVDCKNVALAGIAECNYFVGPIGSWSCSQ